MYKQKNKRFKQGAASFYIVAFSTLILVVLTMSFVAIIVSEATRTSNDDLAQSAYDSALAGIEDAKLAYYNYQSCLESQENYSDVAQPSNDGKPVTCRDIVYWMEHPDCDMVGHILGRIGKEDHSEVYIKETSTNESTAMQQAYTCVKINTIANDYRATLSKDNTTRVVQVKLDKYKANDIKSVRLNWYSNTDGSDYQYTNFDKNGEIGRVTFPTLSKKASTPPTVSLGIVQTDEIFNLDQFDDVAPGATNRGTVFLVPTDSMEKAKSSNVPDNYIGAYVDGEKNNIISAEQIVKSNDRTVKNLPYAVYCDKDEGEFACSATIQLPSPIKHPETSAAIRNDKTFMFVVSIPYGQPSTDIGLEFCTEQKCTKQELEGENTNTKSTAAELKDVQVTIDSTGRANDLYRRIEARIDSTDVYFPYPLYAIELLGEGGLNLNKNMTVTCEYNDWGEFGHTCE